MHVWVEIIGSISSLDTAVIEKLYLPVIGGRYILTGHDRPDRTWRDDFAVRDVHNAVYSRCFLSFNLYHYKSALHHTLRALSNG